MDLKPKLKELLKKKESQNPQDPQPQQPIQEQPQQVKEPQKPIQTPSTATEGIPSSQPIQEQPTDLKEGMTPEQISTTVSSLQDNGIFRYNLLSKITEHDLLLTELGQALVNSINTLNKTIENLNITASQLLTGTKEEEEPGEEEKPAAT